MRDITLMPNDYIVEHIKTDTICEHFSNDDVVYTLDEKIVPLVRCKDCKSWSYSALIDNRNRCERTLKLTKADDFCSYGSRSEKPNNCETCKWWEGNTNFCYSKADSDDHACHYEPKDKWREERSSE